MDTEYVEQDLTRDIIAAAIAVHRELGPGLLESAYVRCLEYELRCRGHQVEREVSFPLRYGEMILDHAYRADLIVQRKVLVEVKAVDELMSVHDAQLLTYLRLTKLPVGLILNFNQPTLRQGIKRFVRTAPRIP